MKTKIVVTQYVETIEPGTKVEVYWGGNGAEIADKHTGVVIPKEQGAKLKWPDYAGEVHEEVVLYIRSEFQGNPIVYGLANSCQVFIPKQEIKPFPDEDTNDLTTSRK